MCDGLADGVEGSVTTPGASPFAVGAEPGAQLTQAGPLASDELADAELAIDEIDSLFDDDGVPAPATESAGAVNPVELTDIDHLLDLGDEPEPAPVEPGAAEGEHLLDLTDLSDPVESATPDSSTPFDAWVDDAGSPAAAAGQPQATDDEAWNWGAPEEQDAPAAGTPANQKNQTNPATAANGARKSELELKRRVNELLASALVHMEKGERAEALRNLDRLLILDESNETALALKHKLMRQDSPEDGTERDDRFAPRATTRRGATTPEPFDSDAAEPAEPEPIDLFAADPATPVPDPIESQSPRRPRPGRPAPDATTAGVSKDGARWNPPGLDAWHGLPSRTKAVYVIGLVSVIFGGLWAIQRFGGSASEPLSATPPPVTRAGGTGVRPTPPVTRPTQTPTTQSTPQTDPAVAVEAIVASEGLPTLLGRASRAMSEGDYAAAVIRYKAVLDREPANRVAARGLIEAGEAYRVQQERQAQQAAAREAFDSGDYHTALRLFYRWPEGDSSEPITRWKFNGWYNLAIGALRTANCHGANDALIEARALSPYHGAIPTLDRLVSQCGTSAPASWRLEVERLTARALDD